MTRTSAAGNKRVSLSGKKGTTNAAADKEKKREKEKRKEERQKQRSVLAEQNSLLLLRMVADEEEDEGILDNTCDVIQDCMEILQVPQNPVPQNVHSPIQNPLQTSQLHVTPQVNVNSSQSTGQPFQPPSSTNVTPTQNPPQPSWSETRNITPVNQSPLQTSLSVPQLQPQSSAHLNVTPMRTPLQLQPQSSIFTPQRARPQFGGKCPRRRQLDEHDEDSECPSCKRLKEEIVNLRNP